MYCIFCAEEGVGFTNLGKPCNKCTFSACFDVVPHGSTCPICGDYFCQPHQHIHSHMDSSGLHVRPSTLFHGSVIRSLNTVLKFLDNPSVSKHRIHAINQGIYLANMLEKPEIEETFRKMGSLLIETQPIFILCDTCYWCATYFDKTRTPLDNNCLHVMQTIMN